MNAVVTVAVRLAGFQQDGGTGGDWPAQAIAIGIGGLVVLVAAITVVIVTGRRPPRSDGQSSDG